MNLSSSQTKLVQSWGLGHSGRKDTHEESLQGLWGYSQKGYGGCKGYRLKFTCLYAYGLYGYGLWAIWLYGGYMFRVLSFSF
jgi:hypothetical protein